MALNKFLGWVNWSVALYNLSCSQAVLVFNDTVEKLIINICHKIRKYPIWFRLEIRDTLAEKHQPRPKYRRTGSAAHLANFKVLRSSTKTVIKSISAYLSNIQSSFERHELSHIIFLKNCEQNISLPFSLIFNKTLYEFVFHDNWPEALIITLH